jgi:hypothetical protein
VPTAADRRRAVADLIGALCYALLRSYGVAARGTAAAPEVLLAERQARFASEEYERFRILRARLGDLTDDPGGAMDSFRAALDAFYEGARSDGWLEAQMFHFVGATLTDDFAEMIAPHLDPDTADAVRRSLTGRTEQEGFALSQITHALETEGEVAHERIRAAAGALVGKAMWSLREAIEASDALEVILGEGAVKELVLEMLGRHRERLERLGLDSVED